MKNVKRIFAVVMALMLVVLSLPEPASAAPISPEHHEHVYICDECEEPLCANNCVRHYFYDGECVFCHVTCTYCDGNPETRCHVCGKCNHNFRYGACIYCDMSCPGCDNDDTNIVSGSYCLQCGLPGAHVHSYSDGECSCGAVCPSCENDSEKVAWGESCDVCGLDGIYHVHNYSNGKCTVCQTNCPVCSNSALYICTGHSCGTCGLTGTRNHSWNDDNGKCYNCGDDCPNASNHVNCECSVCGYCTHHYVNGECEWCGEDCPECDDGDDKCPGCGSTCSTCGLDYSSLRHDWDDGYCEHCSAECPTCGASQTYLQDNHLSYCSTCGWGCYHSYSNGKCEYCGTNCSSCGNNSTGICVGSSCSNCGLAGTRQHQFSEGVCAYSNCYVSCTECNNGQNLEYDETCGTCGLHYDYCPHTSFGTDSRCTVCGILCPVCSGNDFNICHGTSCPTCGRIGRNTQHTYINGYCIRCHKTCVSCGADSSNIYEDSTCPLCGLEGTMPVPQPAHTHKWVCFICGEPLQIPSYELLVKSAEETPAEVKPVEEKPTVKPETPAEVVPETPAETAIEDVEIIPVIDICEEAGNQATEKGVKVSFGEVEDADFYKLYVKYCGGKKYEVRKITPAELDNIEITSINGKPVNTKKNIHLYVVAYKMVDDKEVKLEKSWHSHIAGIDSEMYTNPVDIILDQTEISTWQGRKIVLKPEVVLADETKSLLTDNHTSVFRYKSSDPSIATVNENGKIRAKAKGTCYIYVATINGLTKKIKLTVKDL